MVITKYRFTIGVNRIALTALEIAAPHRHRPDLSRKYSKPETKKEKLIQRP